MDAFTAHLKTYIPDWDAFYDALGKPSKKAFRLTRSRKTPYIEEISELEGTGALSPCSGIPDTYTVKENGNNILSNSISFQTGGIYIMNPASVLPAAILASYTPDSPVILDMAAAPGGKTAVLSDLTGRKGLIIANDPSPSRLKALHFNLEKYGAWNVKSLQLDGGELPEYYADRFDGVLLDAPCSHENHLLINKKISARWTLVYVNKMAALQKRLILAAFDCLKPSGTLVYSTCTFSPEENEGVISYLLDKRSNAGLINLDSPYSIGVSGNNRIDGAVIRVFPHLAPYDGFFVAAVQKGERISTPDGRLQDKAAKEGHFQRFIEKHFTAFPKTALLNAKGSDIYLESPVQLNGNFRRTGMKFAKINSKTEELTSQAVWEFGAFIRPEFKTGVTYKTALEYLKGFDIPRTSEYDGKIFCYGNIPVGIVKIVDNIYKNKLDRYFLYGKNIEW